MKIGITGGIGSGKSYVCKRLEARGIQVYDCDSAAKRLIRTSPDIHDRLASLIGPEVWTDGQLNKAVMAQFLLASEENAKAIDAIVHPAVFRDFEQSGLQWMESAILYESGPIRFPPEVDVPDRIIIRFVPMLFISLCMVSCAPFPIASIIMTAATPIIMPKLVKMERILLALMARSAMEKVVEVSIICRSSCPNKFRHPQF